MNGFMTDSPIKSDPANTPAMGCFGLTSEDFARLDRARAVARAGQTASYSAAMLRALKPRNPAAA